IASSARTGARRHIWGAFGTRAKPAFANTFSSFGKPDMPMCPIYDDLPSLPPNVSSIWLVRDPIGCHGKLRGDCPSRSSFGTGLAGLPAPNRFALQPLLGSLIQFRAVFPERSNLGVRARGVLSIAWRITATRSKT